MSEQHVYDEKQAERLAAIYTAPATVDRRRRMIELLDLTAGDSVLSVGCGPGHEPAALAEDVGEDGRVHGIDNSEEILVMAKDHCAELPQVTLELADAADLPVPDESFDVAVSVQVYAYVHYVETAVAELNRVLRPGGRAAVYSTNWDSFVWHSSDRARMNRATSAWTDVYVNPHLGSQLASYIHDTGLSVEHVEPNSILNTRLDETFAGFVVDLFRGQMKGSEAFELRTIEAWERDLEDLDEAARYFSI